MRPCARLVMQRCDVRPQAGRLAVMAQCLVHPAHGHEHGGIDGLPHPGRVAAALHGVGMRARGPDIERPASSLERLLNDLTNLVGHRRAFHPGKQPNVEVERALPADPVRTIPAADPAQVERGGRDLEVVIAMTLAALLAP